MRSPEPQNYHRLVRLDMVRDFPVHLRGRTDELWNVKRGLGMIAAQTLTETVDDAGRVDAIMESLAPASEAAAPTKPRFGPFVPVKDPTQCVRCGLFAPSEQCGTTLCTKTKWCESCTRTPAHLGGNLLRECLNLRMSQDASKVDMIEAMMKEVLVAGSQRPG